MNRKPVIYWHGMLLLCAMLCLKASTQAAADALTPPPKPVVREPYNPTLTRDTMAFWEEKVRSDPKGAIALRFYADLCLKWARESGDGQFVTLAEDAARRSLKILPARNNASACLILSRSLLTQHRFREALRITEYSASLEDQSNRLRADILCELGQYKQAAIALAKVPHETDDANWNALQARLLEINGHPDEALKLWKDAADIAQSEADWPQETVAWFLFRYGNSLAATGRGDEARKQYLEGLRIFPRDYRSLTALARLSACSHDWKEVVKYGEEAADMVPSFEVLALLGDAYTALGQPKKARDQYRLVEATAALAATRGSTDNRLLALFYLDHNRNLPQALVLARADLANRQDIYTYDTLAWAYYKNRQMKNAQIAMDRALMQGTRDPMLFFHAGMIAAANGNKSAAKKWLQQALNINPRFHPQAPQQAKELLLKL